MIFVIFIFLFYFMHCVTFLIIKCNRLFKGGSLSLFSLSMKQCYSNMRNSLYKAQMVLSNVIKESSDLHKCFLSFCYPTLKFVLTARMLCNDQTIQYFMLNKLCLKSKNFHQFHGFETIERGYCRILQALLN